MKLGKVSRFNYRYCTRCVDDYDSIAVTIRSDLAGTGSVSRAFKSGSVSISTEFEAKLNLFPEYLTERIESKNVPVFQQL